MITWPLNQVVYKLICYNYPLVNNLTHKKNIGRQIKKKWGTILIIDWKENAKIILSDTKRYFNMEEKSVKNVFNLNTCIFYWES